MFYYVYAGDRLVYLSNKDDCFAYVNFYFTEDEHWCICNLDGEVIAEH